MATSHEDEPQLCSKLLGAIVKFWYLILQDQAWTHNLDPSKIPSEPFMSPLSSPDKETHPEIHFGETQSTGDSHLNRFRATVSSDRRKSVFATLSLRGELDRLLYWSAQFTGKSLDRLTQAGVKNEIGSAVLECLTSIAETLCAEYRPPILNDTEEDTLDELRKLAEARLDSIRPEDEAMDDPLDNDDAQSDGATSFASESTAPDSREERLFTSLRFYIGRLQGLSRSMRLVLAGMTGR